MAGWPVGGSGWCGRGLGVGVARPTSATDGQVTSGTGDQGGEQMLDLIARQDPMTGGAVDSTD